MHAYARGRLRRATARKSFGSACQRAGIKNFSARLPPHWATWHYAKNGDLLALQRLGGWKTLTMVTRYAHVNVGELAHTIDNLPWSETDVPIIVNC
jgi:integrase